MAKVKLSGQFEYAQGSWKKPKKVNGHNHGEYIISTHRTAATTSPDCNRAYARDPETYKRTTPLSANETNARARFKIVAGMIKTRKEDLSQIVTDQQTYRAQRDLPNGCKTMKAWYWKVCGEEYDAQH